MAIVVNSDASGFTRTANLPSRTSATLWGWFMPTTDRNTYSGVLGIASAVDALNYRYIETDEDGTSVQLSTYDGGEFVGASLFTWSLNTWYFIALTSAGDGAGQVVAYWRALTANTLSATSVDPGNGGWTPGLAFWGRSSWAGDHMSGRIHACGMADVALSAAELLQISYFHEPQRLGIRGLNCFYPTIEATNSNALIDRSGNGRNATATVGALADSPPLLWVPRRRIFIPSGVVANDQIIEPAGIASAVGYGSHTITKVSAQPIAPSALGSAAAFGTATITNVSAQSVAPTTVASAVAFGSHTVADVELLIEPSLLASAAEFGSATVSNVAAQEVEADTVPSAADFGSATIAKVAAQDITPETVASAATVGDHELVGSSLSSILAELLASAATVGDHTIAHATPQSVEPEAIESAAAVGAHTLTLATPQDITVTMVGSAAGFGSAVVANAQALEIIVPGGIKGNSVRQPVLEGGEEPEFGTGWAIQRTSVGVSITF